MKKTMHLGFASCAARYESPLPRNLVGTSPAALSNFNRLKLLDKHEAGTSVLTKTLVLVLLLSSLFLVGCATPAQTTGLILGAATAAGAYSPDREIEQVYYLGVFDPREQVDPTIYRIRIHGQASLLSTVKFASGWVPAPVVDSLAGRLIINANGNGDVQISHPDSTNYVELTTGRRFWSFGPEGFRENPKDYRLVVVMGGSPDAFFKSIDRALGDIGAAQNQTSAKAVQSKIIEQLLELEKSRVELQEIELQATKTSSQ